MLNATVDLCKRVRIHVFTLSSCCDGSVDNIFQTKSCQIGLELVTAGFGLSYKVLSKKFMLVNFVKPKKKAQVAGWYKEGGYV